MHAAFNYLEEIQRHRFEGSSIIAEGSIAGLMEDHNYNRAVRLHKLVYEALMRHAWKGFIPWLKDTYTCVRCDLHG